MPLARIDLCFSGWVRGFIPSYLTVVATGETIPMPADLAGDSVALQAKINDGTYAISLVDALNTTGNGRNVASEDTEIEIFDVEATK